MQFKKINVSTDTVLTWLCWIETGLLLIALAYNVR